MNPVPIIKTVVPAYNTAGTQIGSIITIDNNFIFGPSTYFSRDTVNTGVNYVENASFLPTNERYLLGTPYASNAEVLTVSSVTLPTNAVPSSVTFSSAPVNRHARGELLSQLMFDQYILSWSATLTGTYTDLAAANLQVNASETIVLNTTATALYFKVRFVNSIATTRQTATSEAIGSGSFVAGTVGYFLQQIRNTLGLNDDPTIDTAFLLSALNEARQIVDREIGTGKMKEWRQHFEYPIKLLAGTNYVTLPSDLDYTETNRSVLAARYSSNSVGASLPLKYVDKREWNNLTYQRRYTTVTVPPNIDITSTNPNLILTGATSVVLADASGFPTSGTAFFVQGQSVVNFTFSGKTVNTLTGVSGITTDIQPNTNCYMANQMTLADSGDFPAIGSVQIQAADYMSNIQSVNYYTNNKNTNVVTNVTGVSSAISAGWQGWAYQTQGYPYAYTVFNPIIDGVKTPQMFFNSVIPQSLNGTNVYIDYYTKYVDLTNLAEKIPEHYGEIYKNYLRFAIKRRRDDTIGQTDPDYVRFMSAATSVFANDYLGQSIMIR